MSQKRPLNTLPDKEKLRNTNTFQLKDKLFTTQNNLLKLKSMLVNNNIKEDMFKVDKLFMFKAVKLNTKLEDNTLLEVKLLLEDKLFILTINQFKVNTEPLKLINMSQLDINNKQLTSLEDQELDNNKDTQQPNKPTLLEVQVLEDLVSDNDLNKIYH